MLFVPSSGLYILLLAVQAAGEPKSLLAVPGNEGSVLPLP